MSAALSEILGQIVFMRVQIVLITAGHCYFNLSADAFR